MLMSRASSSKSAAPRANITARTSDPPHHLQGATSVRAELANDEDASHPATLQVRLDEELARFSGIPVAQLDPVEHAIVWIGLHELKNAPEVPYRVVINEGIELAKKFGATDGHRFVNAVLDRASVAHRDAERGAGARDG